MEIETGTSQLLASTEDGVGTVVFNNPEKRNAFSRNMIDRFGPVLRGMDEDRDIRCIVLEGAGERAFVSGADISELAADTTAGGGSGDNQYSMARVWEAMIEVRTPVVAKIRGFCLGGGLVVAMHADLRITSETGVFGIPAVRIGRGYSLDGVRKLVELVNPTWAAEILLTGRRLTAPEAKDAGLVSRVVEDGSLDEEVRTTASRIAANAPLAVRAARSAIREAVKPREHQDDAAIAELVDACLRSEDYREGRQAFLEKRRPVFRGD